MEDENGGLHHAVAGAGAEGLLRYPPSDLAQLIRVARAGACEVPPPLELGHHQRIARADVALIHRDRKQCLRRGSVLGNSAHVDTSGYPLVRFASRGSMRLETTATNALQRPCRSVEYVRGAERRPRRRYHLIALTTHRGICVESGAKDPRDHRPRIPLIAATIELSGTPFVKGLRNRRQSKKRTILCHPTFAASSPVGSNSIVRRCLGPTASSVASLWPMASAVPESRGRTIGAMRSRLT